MDANMLNLRCNGKVVAVLFVVALSVMGLFSLSSRSDQQVVNGSASQEGPTASARPTETLVAHRVLPRAVAKQVTHSDTRGSVDPIVRMKVIDAYRTLRQCATSMRAINSMRRQISACDASVSVDTAYGGKCGQLTAGFDEEIKEDEALLDVCDQKSPASIEQEFYDNVVLAAKLGDEDARICYISSSFDLGRSWFPEEIAQYKSDAPGYIDDAFNRGDWRVVGLMMTSTRVLSHLGNSLLTQILTGDSAATYRMNRLARLGATDSYAAQLDTMAQYPDRPLSTEDIAQGDSWARKMYEQHFSRSPTLEGAPTYCE